MLDGKKMFLLAGNNPERYQIESFEIARAMKSVNARLQIVRNPKYLVSRLCFKETVSGDEKDSSIHNFDAIIICDNLYMVGSDVIPLYTQLLKEAERRKKLVAAIGTGLELLDFANFMHSNDTSFLDIDVLGNGLKAGQNKPVKLILANKPVHIMRFVNAVVMALR